MLAHNPGKFLLLSYFQNLSLRPLCALGVSAVGMPVKEVHRRDAEYAKEAQRVEIRAPPPFFAAKANRDVPAWSV
jgi:hypothetical protein